MGQTVVNVLHCRISIYPRNLTSNHMSLFLTYMKALHHQPLIIFNTGFINLISVSSACQSWYLPLLSFWFEGSPTSPHREEQRTGLSDQQKDRVRIINHSHTLQGEALWGRNRAIAWPWTAVHLITLYLHTAIADHRQQRRIKAISGWDIAEHVSQVVSGCLGNTSSLSEPCAQTGAACQICNLNGTPLGAGSFVFALARRQASWCNGWMIFISYQSLSTSHISHCAGEDWSN